MSQQTQRALEPSIPTDQEIQNAEIERLKVQASEVNEDSRQFMEPEPPKRKRGRPASASKRPKVEAEAPQPGPTPEAAPTGPTQEAVQACRFTWSMASGALVKMFNDDRMAFAPDELEGISMSWALVVDKHAPDLLNKYGAEIAAAGTTAALIFRLRATANLIQAERKAKMEAERSANEKDVENSVVAFATPTMN